MVQRTSVAGGFACSLVLLLVNSTTNAATVAHWSFEASAFEADSVGGHALSNSGVTSSVDTSAMAPGSGSAFFSGSQAVFSTIQSLDLSAFSDLTVEYFIKAAPSGTAVVFEHFGSNEFAPGVIGSAINDFDVSNFVEGYQRGTTGTYISGSQSNVLSVGEWHHVAVTIDGSETGSNRISLFVDGVEVGTDTSLSPTGTPSFLNEVFYIGSRGNSQLKFSGLLDELRISDTILSPSEFLIIPEPATLAILAAGCACGLLWRRRRCV